MRLHTSTHPYVTLYTVYQTYSYVPPCTRTYPYTPLRKPTCSSTHQHTPTCPDVPLNLCMPLCTRSYPFLPSDTALYMDTAERIQGKRGADDHHCVHFRQPLRIAGCCSSKGKTRGTDVGLNRDRLETEWGQNGDRLGSELDQTSAS